MRTRLGIVNWTIVMTSFVMMVGVRTFHPPLVHFHSHDSHCHNSSECDSQAVSQQTTSLAAEEQQVHRHGENQHSHNHSGCSASSNTISKQSGCESRTADACSTAQKSKSASRARCGHLHTHSTATHRHHHNHGDSEESDDAPADGQQDLPCHSESCLLCQFLIQAIQPLDCPVMLTGEERVAERPVSEILEVVTMALSGPYVRGPPQLV